MAQSIYWFLGAKVFLLSAISQLLQGLQIFGNVNVSSDLCSRKSKSNQHVKK